MTFVEEKPEDSLDPRKTPHYYGHIVRRYFLTGGVILLLSLPFYAAFFDKILVLFLVFSVIVFGLAAGATNPLSRGIIICNVIIAALAVAFFESLALYLYLYYDKESFLMILNTFLAMLFFIALYYSIKSLRSFPPRMR